MGGRIDNLVAPPRVSEQIVVFVGGPLLETSTPYSQVRLVAASTGGTRELPPPLSTYFSIVCMLACVHIFEKMVNFGDLRKKRNTLTGGSALFASTPFSETKSTDLRAKPVSKMESASF